MRKLVFVVLLFVSCSGEVDRSLEFNEISYRQIGLLKFKFYKLPHDVSMLVSQTKLINRYVYDIINKQELTNIISEYERAEKEFYFLKQKVNLLHWFSKHFLLDQKGFELNKFVKSTDVEANEIEGFSDKMLAFCDSLDKLCVFFSEMTAYSESWQELDTFDAKFVVNQNKKFNLSFRY